MWSFKKKQDKKSENKPNENNIVDNLNPWAKPDKKNVTQQQQQPQQSQQPQQQQAQVDAKPDMKKFFQSQGLYDDVDPSAMMAAMRDGDSDAFEAQVAKIMENAVSVALNTTGTLVDKRLATFKDQTVADSVTASDMKMAIASMNTKLPFTASEEMAPMAEQVLKGFMQQEGMTAEKAIEKTGEYFKAVSGEVATAMNYEVREKSSRDGFSGSNMRGNDITNNENDDNAQDWASIISGGVVTADTDQQNNGGDS